jgi:SAM-dependent methyltransferase
MSDPEHLNSAISKRFTKDYFSNRHGNDLTRQKQFDIDGRFIRRFISAGRICDIGCSTGEFLQAIDWRGERYRTEINDEAKKIASKQISFEKNIFTEKDFFDIVIMRGVLQHLDAPFAHMKATFQSLKPGGYLVILATPNANGIYYRRVKTLPFLDPNLNFYIPGDKELLNSLENFGYKIHSIEYPYIETPYARPLLDHLKFAVNFVFRRQIFRHAFHGSIMQITARKKNV